MRTTRIRKEQAIVGQLAAMFATLLGPLVMGIPIAVTLGLAGIVWLVAFSPNLLNGLGYALWNTANSYILVAVPLFLAMGEVIQRSAIGARFYRALSPLVSWLPGGLLHSNLAACAVFAAVSGSSVATAATIGSTAIPELTRLGYRRSMVFGTLSAGGTIGILIPPSIPLIIYAALVEESVGQLFVAAVVPGLLVFLLFSAYVVVRALRDPQSVVHRGQIPAQAPTATPPWWRLLADLLPITAIILVVLGGIYFGIATPTEVAALGLLISLLIALLYGSLTWAVLRDSIASAVRFTAMITFVIIGANIFSFALFSWGLTREVAGGVAGLEVAPEVVIALLVAIYIVLGMFIDPISMMVLTVSVVAPIVERLGFDLVWFGIVLVLLLEIGLITPPVGINLYTIKAIAGSDVGVMEIARGALPFVLLLLVAIALLVALPGLAMWLPTQMYR